MDTPIYRVSRDDPLIVPMRSRGKARVTSAHRLSAHPDSESIDSNKLELLPTTAESFFGDSLEKFGWKGSLELLFAGTRDNGSPLAALREHESTLVREIYSYVGNQFAKHVKLTVPAALVGAIGARDSKYMQFNHGRGRNNWQKRTLVDDACTTSHGYDNGFVAFVRCGQILEFPEPIGRNVNMMPFIFGDKDSLPSFLQSYHPLIEQCPYMKDDVGKVGYLTVHESYIDVGKAQRRTGLHIESPGVFSDGANSSSFTPGVEHPWGMGVFYGPDRHVGGIYMASNIAATSIVWDSLVDNRVPGIVDRHGGCEHLRGLIGQGTKLEAGELIWMTDCTPHEACPQIESGYRQFFRVVTQNVSHWYADHSTENPNVPLPSNVTVVRGNKFVRTFSELEV